ncbi:hypothetical protein [Salinibacterium sp. GXW1014]|uniref:hypothetical protein n=1 Tax=Salinibacterium sp. GXW1014 TaxID=3377838 RepID=UPI00383BC57F
MGDLLSEEGDWIRISAHGAGADSADFAALAEGVADSLASAARNDVSVPSQDLAATCDDIADIDLIRGTLETNTPLMFAGGGGGWSPRSAAQSMAGLPGIPSCGISAASNDLAAYGTIDWLQEAEWAFDSAGVEELENVSVPGAREDSGYATCDEADDSCSVHFVLDGNWVIVTAVALQLPFDDPTIQASEVAPRDAALAIAALVSQ